MTSLPLLKGVCGSVISLDYCMSRLYLYLGA